MVNSKDERREAILAAAFEAFKTYGLKKITLEDIAEKVGMATSSLYYYFDSKKKLFQALLENEAEKMLNVKQEALARADTTEEKLYAVWTTMSDTMDKLEGLSPTEVKNLQDGIWEAREFMATWQAEHERITRELLEKGVEEGVFEVQNPRETSFIISSTMRGLFGELISGGEAGKIRWASKSLMNLLLRGLKKR